MKFNFHWKYNAFAGLAAAAAIALPATSSSAAVTFKDKQECGVHIGVLISENRSRKFPPPIFQNILHREAVGERRDAAVEQHRLVGGEHFQDHIVEVGGVVAAQDFAAVGFGELDEVGQRLGVAFGIAVAVQQLLPLPHHAHVLVVEDERLDRQPVLHGRAHLLDTPIVEIRWLPSCVLRDTRKSGIAI
jgi:hypothetical protein